ncbi:MAG: plasmid pRiA4b ORF-3 family protein [Terracoccus sp.]
MEQTPKYPHTPAGMKAWLETLGSADLNAVTASMARGLGAAASGDGAKAEAFIDPSSSEIELPEPPGQPVLLTVHISLDDTDPQVWRRLTMPGDLHLDELHEVLQAAMGWTDSHLHRFHLGDAWRGPHFLTGDDLDEGENGTTETEARLDQVLRAPDDELGYTYDVDGWNHTLRLESLTVLEPTEGTSDTASRSACLDGARACPPEDIGGIPGYEEAAEWVRHDYDIAHAPEGQDAAGLAELRAWLPPGWHPDEFSVDEVYDDLARLTTGGTAVSLALLPEELQVFVTGVSKPSRLDLDAWLAHPEWSEPVMLDPDTTWAVTRPVRVVRDLVGDGISLTSAGYLPPRAVEQIFATLDLSSEWIGKGNREDLTPPVADLREAVRSLGLIRRVKGRLVPTALGRKLADDPERLLAQVAQRLPLETDAFGRLTSLVLLLAVGGGVPYGGGDWHGQQRELRDGLLDVVCRVLGDAGWQTQSRPLSRHDVMLATSQTCHLLDLMLREVGSTTVPATLARLILSNAA